MLELWKPIAGYEGLYEVSSLGNIASLNYAGKKGIRKNMVPGADKDGYLQVALSKNGKVVWRKVHRLVAKAFIDNPDNLPQINHKDENVKNNTVDNLEWCTGKYNVNYGTAMARKTAKQSKPVIAMSNDGIERAFPSIRAAARALGRPNHSGSICNAIKTGRELFGYTWKEVAE